MFKISWKLFLLIQDHLNGNFVKNLRNFFGTPKFTIPKCITICSDIITSCSNTEDFKMKDKRLQDFWKICSHQHQSTWFLVCTHHWWLWQGADQLASSCWFWRSSERSRSICSSCKGGQFWHLPLGRCPSNALGLSSAAPTPGPVSEWHACFQLSPWWLLHSGISSWIYRKRKREIDIFFLK